MKCKFCGTNNDTVITRMNGMDLCDECESIRVAREPKEEVEMIEEAIIAPEVEAELTPPSDVKAEIVIGVKNDGSLYFNAGGSDVNLLVIDGLLKFADRRMKQIWDQRDANPEQALDVNK